MAFDPQFIRAVAFDLDDTLFDRTAAATLLFRSWLGEISLSEEEEILRRDESGHSSRPRFFQWFSARYPHLRLTGPALWDRFRAELPGFLAPDSSVLPLLGNLSRRGIGLAVLTDGSRALQMAKFRALGLDACLSEDRVVVSSELGTAKPDPRAFAALTARLGVTPDRTLFVGDHWEKDMIGARGFGMKTCWLNRHMARLPPESSADLVIDSPGKLLSLWPSH